MRKINLLVIAILTGALSFFTSCDDETTVFDAPTVVFDAGFGDQTVDALAQDVIIKGTATAAGEIAEITFLKDGSSYGDAITTGFDQDTLHVFSVTISAAEVTEDFTLAVQVTDKQDSPKTTQVTAAVTVTVDAGVTEYTITLGDQDDADGSFLDLLTNATYGVGTCEANAADIDLIYYYGATGAASIYSPQGMVDAGITSFGNVVGWATHTNAFFISDSSADYDNATSTSVQAGADLATDHGITQLSEGDLIYFKTDSGKCGLIKVGTIVPRKGLEEVTLSYKLQNDAS